MRFQITLAMASGPVKELSDDPLRYRTATKECPFRRVAAVTHSEPWWQAADTVPEEICRHGARKRSIVTFAGPSGGASASTARGPKLAHAGVDGR
jgi:hypothetical protein